MYHKTVYFVKYLFSFFIYFFQFFCSTQQAIPTKKNIQKNITLIFSALKTIGSKKTSA